MFVRIWHFHARPEMAAQFRAAYGPEGDWASLFRRSAGYLGTELLQASADANSFVTLDRWTSDDAWRAFLRAWRNEYAALDRQYESLTDAEREIGEFRVPVTDEHPGPQ
jgi:heme-degrading monooxygenase HmoA